MSREKSFVETFKRLRLRNRAWGSIKDEIISKSEKEYFEERFVALLEFNLDTGYTVPDHVLTMAAIHDKLNSVVVSVTTINDLYDISAFLRVVTELYSSVRDGINLPSAASTFHVLYLAFKLRLQMCPLFYNYLDVSRDLSDHCNEDIVQKIVYAKITNLKLSDIAIIPKTQPTILLKVILSTVSKLENVVFENINVTLQRFENKKTSNTSILSQTNFKKIAGFVENNVNGKIIESNNENFVTFALVRAAVSFAFERGDILDKLYEKLFTEIETEEQLYAKFETMI